MKVCSDCQMPDPCNYEDDYQCFGCWACEGGDCRSCGIGLVHPRSATDDVGARIAKELEMHPGRSPQGVTDMVMAVLRAHGLASESWTPEGNRWALADPS